MKASSVSAFMAAGLTVAARIMAGFAYAAPAVTAIALVNLLGYTITAVGFAAMTWKWDREDAR